MSEGAEKEVSWELKRVFLSTSLLSVGSQAKQSLDEIQSLRLNQWDWDKIFFTRRQKEEADGSKYRILRKRSFFFLPNSNF